jgi:hypothetical protein
MAVREPREPLLIDDPNRDLGFGAVVARESRRRRPPSPSPL